MLLHIAVVMKGWIYAATHRNFYVLFCVCVRWFFLFFSSANIISSNSPCILRFGDAAACSAHKREQGRMCLLALAQQPVVFEATRPSVQTPFYVTRWREARPGGNCCVHTVASFGSSTEELYISKRSTWWAVKQSGAPDSHRQLIFV